MSKIPNHLTEIKQRIATASKNCGRNPQTVQLLAVTKTKPAEDLRIAYAAGQRCFGENYVQEALDKQQKLHDLDIEWHFIGPIQSNKTRPIAEHFDWVHSVDRLKIAQRLNQQRPASLPPLNICLQVNLDDEASKSGVSLQELPALLSTINDLEHLRVRGFMAIPAARCDTNAQQRVLQSLSDALAQWQPQYPQLDTLSMGMSGDLEAAVAAGSTMVRIGTDIFGARNTLTTP